MKHRWFLAIISSLFMMPIVAIGVLGSWNLFQVKALPIISQIPDFVLQERSGKTLGLKDLSGKVWIGSFIFTHCSGQCPMITQRVRKLQHDLRHRTEVRFLSFSVDPENDTQAALDEYAKRFEANPLKWFFVTGNRKAIEKVVHDGFKMVMEPNDLNVPNGPNATNDANKANGAEAVMHSFKLALVDPWGRVRGYYDANDDVEMKNLLKDTRRLIKQSF